MNHMPENQSVLILLVFLGYLEPILPLAQAGMLVLGSESTPNSLPTPVKGRWSF